MSKQRNHSFIVTVTMDKPCTRKRALAEVKDNIHGEHYCTPFEEGDPDTFRIRSIKLEKPNAQ